MVRLGQIPRVRDVRVGDGFLPIEELELRLERHPRSVHVDATRVIELGLIEGDQGLGGAARRMRTRRAIELGVIEQQ
jgi:hypothetical protein